MEHLLIYVLLGIVFLIFLSLQILFYVHRSHFSGSNLPPGATGWPIIGESLEFLKMGWQGQPERFVVDRMRRYSQLCFKTCILGEPMAVFNGPHGNKFLFSNESKLVEAWWPSNVEKIFPSSIQTNSGEEAKRMRALLPQFLKPDALKGYIEMMDRIAARHLDTYWANKEEIKVYPLAKRLTFWIACRVFMSLEDPNHIARLVEPFKLITSGIMTIPIDLPGTPYNRAIKASGFIRKELREIIKQRKVDLAEGRATATQDILSHMLTAPIIINNNIDGTGTGTDTDTDTDKEYINEINIADKILGLLIGGYDTASITITFIIKFLAELPHVYNQVYKEQMEIAKSKAPGQVLNWNDVQKMKYSWNVACEVMRLVPPLQGSFREALHDFSYGGFHIPKGWKLYWSVNSTHRNPQYFPKPEKFDPSRFDGAGPGPYTYVPFGGGPRMCPGKEYARLEILVFMHNVVKRFKWEKIIPDENIVVDPMPVPAKGLPIRLRPHNN